ncbi:MAG TPA: sodium:solute symporter, partial [Pirellulales bacterium]|nr:sodium:solute symporter [Pirellulales bacterium]
MAEPASTSAGIGTLLALLLFIAASVWLGTVAQRVVEKGSFLRGYFLGNRGLGAWALALTATVQSGGTFMGFPAYVYTHGWIVALWIAAYMVVPLSGFGVLGKRFAQLSRRTGAITVPDLFRARFASPTTGLMASLLILFFMTFMMVAQFKAGAIVMKISWPGSGALAIVEDAQGGNDRYYFLGLAIFSITVVGYTLIGGFLAAFWTDLFQSVM